MKKRLLATIPVLLVVFLCSGNVFATTLTPNENYNTSFQYLNGDFRVYVNATIYKPYLMDYDYNFVIGRTYYGTSNNPYPANPYNWNSSGTTQFYDIPVTISVNFTNYADYLVYGDTNYIGITPVFNYDIAPDCWYVEELSEDLCLYQVTNSGQFRFSIVNPNLCYGGKIALAKNGLWTFSFKIHFLYHYTLGAQNGTTYPQIDGTSMNQSDWIDFTSVTVNAPTDYTLTSVDASYNPIVNDYYALFYLKAIRDYAAVQNNGYSDNIQNSQNVTSDSTTLDNQIDTLHNLETGYYTQTNTALANTGLSNFSFGNTTVNAIATVKDQFTYVWNKLNTFSIVYTFSLTLGVAMLIIRHVRPIRRHNEE